MMRRDPFKYFETSPEIIRLAVRMYIRFPLSLRKVAEILRGIPVSVAVPVETSSHSSAGTAAYPRSRKRVAR